MGGVLGGCTQNDLTDANVQPPSSHLDSLRVTASLPLDEPILLSTIEYYDSDGTRARTYLDTTRVLGPLASTYVVVDVDDIRGGVGANFLVRWHAETPVSPPVVETVMITTESRLASPFGARRACCRRTA